jgi:hypothetical protein
MVPVRGHYIILTKDILVKHYLAYTSKRVISQLLETSEYLRGLKVNQVKVCEQLAFSQDIDQLIFDLMM